MSSDYSLGFTGSRNGMNARQVVEFMRRVREFDPCEFHHGCCVGADEQAVVLVSALNTMDLDCRIVGHPPAEKGLVSNVALELSWVLRDEAPYLVRNHRIVDETRIAIGAPSGAEVVRSGTWATLRYARKLKRTGYVLMPHRTVGL